MAINLCDNTNTVLAIFFDLDNTLIQTRKADSKACKKVVDVLIQQYGFSEEEAVKAAGTFLVEYRKDPDNEKYDLDRWRIKLWSNAFPEQYKYLAGDVFVQWLELRYHYLALTSEVIELLKVVREHYLLGLITNGPSRAQWEKVDRLQLREYFDCILVSGDLPWEKPDQEIFHKACSLLDVEPKQCIMVGDKLETDIQGGKEAELAGTVWIPLSREAEKENMNVRPDFTIHSVTDLPELLPSTPKHSIQNNTDKMNC